MGLFDWAGEQGSRFGYWVGNGFDGRSAQEKAAANAPKPAGLPTFNGMNPYGINPAGATQQAIAGQKDKIAAGIDREGLYSGTSVQKARTNMEGLGPNIGNPGSSNGGLSFDSAANAAGAVASNPLAQKAAGAAAGLVGARSLGYLGGGDGGQGGDHQATLTSMLKQQMANDATNQTRIENLYNAMSQRANPYDTNSEAFRRSQALAVNNANRSMQGAEHRAQVGLAGRGMMGSGQEAAALGSIAAQRGALVSNTENSLYADTMQRGYEWQRGQDNSLVALLNGSRQDPTQLAMQMALWGRQDDQRSQDRLYETGMSLAELIAKYYGGQQ